MIRVWTFIPWLLVAFVAAGQECRIVQVSPAQPPLKVEEGERATESQTFQTNAFVLGPNNTPHFFDTASRIRRVDANGRITTLAGNGLRDDIVVLGPARNTPLPNVTQIVFDGQGVLHFAGGGRVFRLRNGNLELVAGTGRPGFNGESGVATEVNLGGIVKIAFDYSGQLLIIDGFNRVRAVSSDGRLRTIAGSTRVAATAGRTGDDGPATEAALSSPRQIFPFRDGSLWINDLSGRHMRIVTPDGIIRTFNTNFEPSVNIIAFPDGTPGGATANRVYPIRSNGNIETGAAPFPPFTGTPLAISTDNALYFTGGTRPEFRTPVVRLANRVETVIASAPVPPVVDGQSGAFAMWNPRTNTLLYAAAQDDKFGILEARPGQSPRFVVGGGTETNEPEGKRATDITLFGIVAFTIDAEGRIIIGDLFRRRILVIESGGTVSILKSGGQPVVYSPLGSLSNLQRIAADAAGNIYWVDNGATPTGGIFTAEVVVWNRSNGNITQFTVPGINALSRGDDGLVQVIAGNSATFRNAYRATPTGLGEIRQPYTLLPLGSVTQFQGEPYFTTTTRLFRGASGRIDMFNELLLPNGGALNIDYVLASPNNLYVHASDGGFYRIDNLNACQWLPQPTIDSVVSAANFQYPDRVALRQLVTVFGKGLGPADGQGMVLDGALRATAQPAPFPTLSMSVFTGALPFTTLTGGAMPVVFSNDRQMTVQVPATNPQGGLFVLYFNWNGLTLRYPQPIRVVAAVPALFQNAQGEAAALNDDGSRNSPSRPAPKGSVVQLFATGLGATTANIALGDFFSLTTPATATNTVTAEIAGEPANVLFAGGAPGQIGGVYQLNVEIPESAPAGLQTLTITVAGESTTARISIGQ